MNLEWIINDTAHSQVTSLLECFNPNIIYLGYFMTLCGDFKASPSIMWERYHQRATLWCSRPEELSGQRGL